MNSKSSADQAAHIKVIAVDDQQANHIIYSHALESAADIEYLGWLTHVEAMDDATSWNGVDVVLLDLGVPRYRTDNAGQSIPFDRNPSQYDEFPGFDVARRIRQLHPEARSTLKPFLAVLTGYSKEPQVRERARANGCLNAFYDRSLVTYDDGQFLRQLVREAADGNVVGSDFSGEVVPEPPITQFRQELIERSLPRTDVLAALDDGIAHMKRLGLTLDQYLAPPAEWDNKTRRRLVDPVTKTVAEHFANRYRDNGEILGFAINRLTICESYRYFYFLPDR